MSGRRTMTLSPACWKGLMKLTTFSRAAVIVIAAAARSAALLSFLCRTTIDTQTRSSRAAPLASSKDFCLKVQITINEVYSTQRSFAQSTKTEKMVEITQLYKSN